MPLSRRSLLLALVFFSLGANATSFENSDSSGLTFTVRAYGTDIEEGYFPIGEYEVIVAKHGTKLHTWLSQRVGQKIRIENFELSSIK